MTVLCVQFFLVLPLWWGDSLLQKHAHHHTPASQSRTIWTISMPSHIKTHQCLEPIWVCIRGFARPSHPLKVWLALLMLRLRAASESPTARALLAASDSGWDGRWMVWMNGMQTSQICAHSPEAYPKLLSDSIFSSFLWDVYAKIQTWPRTSTLSKSLRKADSSNEATMANDHRVSKPQSDFVPWLASPRVTEGFRALESVNKMVVIILICSDHLSQLNHPCLVIRNISHCPQKDFPTATLCPLRHLLLVLLTDVDADASRPI